MARGQAEPPRHARRPVGHGGGARAVGLVVTVVVLFGASSAAALAVRLQSNLVTVDIGSLVGPPPATGPGGAAAPGGPGAADDQAAGRALNLLVLGTDMRDGGNAAIGGADDSHASDTAIVVHLAAARDRVELVSIPRDSMVDIPSCRAGNGRTTMPRHDMINSAFATGWAVGGDVRSAAACTTSTVQADTGLRIDHVVVVDFVGFQAMVSAIGGVTMCIPRELDDPDYTGLHLLPGRQRLTGVQALQLARARHGNIGNGGDLARIGNQQRLVAAIVAQVLSGDVLANPVKLTAFLEAATSSLTVDAKLDLAGLTGLAYSLRSVGASGVTLTTLPTQPWPPNHNRLVWAPEAAAVWANMAADRPIVRPDGTLSPMPGLALAAPGSPASGSPAPAASPTPVPTRTRQAGAEPFTPADVTAVCG